jgi:large subunit ribosomal protein L24
MHIKTGDEVLVITGKDHGKRGKIKEALPKENRVVVEGLNMIKRHTKARGQGKPSGIIEREAPLQASNVMLICPRCGRAARTGQRFLDETDHKGRPRKVRFCKACDETVDE